MSPAMTLLYKSAGGYWRHNVSLAILIAVGVYGIFELWRAYTFGGGEVDWLFAVAFAAGSVYGLWQLIEDTRDRVIAFRLDEATGATEAALWRPFFVERLATEAGRIGNWRAYVKLGPRNNPSFFVYADNKDYPRPLVFDMRGAEREGLRRIAPEAVADLESRMGVKPR
jgi:hypothetical protein